MVDHVRALGWKITFAKLVVFAFTLFLFFWIAPVPQFNILQDVDFTSAVISFWLGVVGVAFMLEGWASTPDAKRGASKTGAYVLILMGVVSFIFSAVTILYGVEVLFDETVRLLATLLMFFGMIIFLVTLAPELIHHKSFVKALN